MNIAVAGYGFMGQTHASNILKIPDLRLVALVDRSPEITSKIESSGNFSTGTLSRESLEAVHVYTQLDECLSKESLDACVIAVHTDLHFEMARMSLEAGVSVFLEKPFSLEMLRCEQLIDLAARKNLLLMVGHVVRFMPAYRILKGWIDYRDFGDLKFLSLTRFSGLPAWGQWKEKKQQFGSTGGALFDLVIHDIDFARWVLGDPWTLSSVCLPGELSKHDYVNATWNYDTGLVIKIEGGNIFHSAFPFQAGYTARFEQASVIYTSNNPNIQVAMDAETLHIPAGDANEGFTEELDYFTRCLRSHQYPDRCTPESAMKTIELCYKHSY